MTERDLEESLRAGYREIVDRSAPGNLRVSVSELPDLVPADRKPALVGRVLPFALAATAATVALAVGIGTALLMLPASAADGSATGFRTALFTSTSAVCVTGLAVVDTATPTVRPIERITATDADASAANAQATALKPLDPATLK